MISEYYSRKEETYELIRKLPGGTNMDYYDKANRIIRSLVAGGNTEFIIYPFGIHGIEVKQILNQVYRIEEKYIVDNGKAALSENKKVIDLKELKNIDIGNMLVLLTSDNEDIYSELRWQLLQVVDFENIVDIFSYSAYYDRNVFNDDAGKFSDFRIAALYSASKEIYFHNVDGAIAECGVSRGDFAKYINRFMPDRKLYLFDTFGDFLEEDITMEETQENLFRLEGNLRDISAEQIIENIGHHANIVIRKGHFPETAQGLENEKFAFVSLNMDLYMQMFAGLEFFYPKMSPGGYIFIHDFKIGLSGVRKAVEEFCRKENIGIVVLPDEWGTAVLSKPL